MDSDNRRVKVSFPQFNIVVDAPIGTSILEVAQQTGIGIRSVCGGKGLCGKCKVLVRGRVEHRLTDKSLIRDDELSKGYVLACMAKVLEDVEVFIPPESQFKKAKLLSHVVLPSFTLDPVVKSFKPSDYLDAVKLFSFYRAEEELYKKALELLNREGVVYVVVDTLNEKILDVKTDNSTYGVAIDIGTTKIVCAVIDLNSGKIVDVDSEFNKQMMFGEDIVSRLSRAVEKEGLVELQRATVETINSIIKRIGEKHGIDPNNIYYVSAAGNTAMTYLFVGANPYELIRSFREPVKVDPRPRILNAQALGLNTHRNALVYVLPCSGRFLGGDVIGDILTAGINFSDDVALLIDIGTNTEVVIGCRNWFLGTTAPAGPAFEGWGLRCGVRAVEGAIESVRIDSETLEPTYSTIGNTKPIGICGSGYIDLVAQLFVNGVIDNRGKFYRDINHPRIRKGDDGYEYVIVFADQSATGNDIVITEKDIYNIIDSKSSVCAAISILLKSMHLDVYSIKKVFVCGAFGRYLNVDSAIAIGMIPELPNAELTYIGNGSLGGAILTALSRDHAKEAENVAKYTATIELLLDPNFMEEYEAGFILPGKPELFPNWWRRSKGIKPWSARKREKAVLNR
uniref:DUF4445 domain-containing protein n=1 Tax=Ignisphaera aggregans TaxID=334771 RepID=A0A7C2ZPH6_9CREN